MKRIIGVLACIVLTGCFFIGLSITASAASEGNYYYTIENGGATISNRINHTGGNIVVPSTLGGYPVKRIGEFVFYGDKDVTSIELPQSVTTIDNRAFWNCTGLKSINLPNSIESIGHSAFRNCTSLNNVTLPKNIKSINYDIFYDCSALTEITIPEGVAEIGKNAFYNCSSLTTISLPTTLTKIGAYCFQYCEVLNNVKIKNIDAWCTISFESDSACPLYYADNLYLNNSLVTTVTLSNNTTHIGDYAFYGYKNLTGIVIPNSVTSIGKYAFYCTSLTNVTIPNGVTSIGEYSFYATPITNIVIPNGVTKIGTYTFYGCKNLKSAVIPDSVTSMGQGVFYRCSSLESANLPKDITTIEKETFYECKILESVVIPNGVTKIGTYAFSSCDKLKSVSIPNSVKQIDYGAFNFCWALKNVSYNGTEQDYSKISISSGNSYFTNATVDYFLYVNLYDLQGNRLSNTKQEPNSILDISEFVEEDKKYIIYTDEDKSDTYSPSAPIVKNLDLYIDLNNPICANTIKLNNQLSETRGGEFIVRPYMAIENDTYYMYYIMSYPNSLVLKEITSKSFDTVTKEDESTTNGTTTLTLLCQGSSALPTSQGIIPFELSFEVSKTAPIGTIDLTIDETTCYIGEDTYQFSELISSKLTIEPKLAESISIIGQDAITGTSTYTIGVLPDYATYQVVWSVDKTEIAEVDTNGVVTPKKSGTIILTANTTDGSNLTATKEITITMKAKLTSVTSDIGEWDKVFNSDITEYTVYVDKDTSKIKLTSKCVAGAKLTVNNETAIPNIAKPINLDNDTTLISIKISGVADCEDNTYTFTIIKKKPRVDATVSSDGKSFIISPKYIENGNLVILALYNGDKFIKLYDEIYQGQDIPFNNVAETYDKVKIMVWSDFETLIPLCEANSTPTVIE